jgi:hypothetical protein
MNRPKNRVELSFVIFIIIVSMISLACGSSTTDKLASAIPPTTEQNQQAVPALATSDSQSPLVTATSDSQSRQPTATQKIASSPTPLPEALVVGAQGMGQDGSSVGYGFMVKNPNQNYAIENTAYQVAVYNSEGTVIKTDSGYINLILPGQELGVGGDIYLDEGLTASKIVIQLNDGQPSASDLIDTFTTDKVVYTASDYFSDVRGVITSPYNKDISTLHVSALLFNDAKEIIGGGYTYVNFVKAQSSTGVSISVAGNGTVAYAELYPTITSLSELDLSSQIPADAQDIVLKKQGFGQDGVSLGVGLIFTNPNQGYSIENSEYRVTAYAEDGSVLDVSEGYIELLMPDQTFGVADNMYLDEGVNVATVEIQMMPGTYYSSDPLPAFTFENAAYLPNEYDPKITGEVVSPYSKDITNLRVNAIAYDEAGNIIGSGFTYLDFVPANSKSAVSVSVTTSGVPATVELYASITSLSDIEE